MSAPVLHAATARSGAASLQVEVGGRRLWVHSPVDPAAEAERQAAVLGLDDRVLLVVAGGGLGWLARAAAARAPAGVLLLEPPGLPRPEAELPPGAERVAGEAEHLVAVVTGRQQALGWPDLAVVHNPAYARAFPAWAARLARDLPAGRRPSRLGARRREGPRPWPPRLVLLLDSGYYLLRECREALAELGLETLSVPLRAGGARDPATSGADSSADAGYIDRLLSAVTARCPDLVLTINHLGLDRAGRVQDLLASLGIPLAVWYVDSPAYILDGARATGGHCHVFCWERAWLPALHRAGFSRATHLPLAGSRGFLRRPRPARGVSLVAGSNTAAVAKWRRLLDCPPRLAPALEPLLAEAAAMPRGSLPDAWLEARLAAAAPLRAWLDEERRRRLASLLVLAAGRADRAALVRAFAGRDLDLHGDPGWRELAPGRTVSPPLDYYRELADHFAAVRVTLNATSRQMPGTVNQRLFDAPLAGAVVLTDAQADLEEFFDPGTECAVYHEAAAAPALAEALLADEPRRTAMAARARACVIGRHLYRHRVARMLEEMGRELGAGRRVARAAPRPIAEVMP